MPPLHLRVACALHHEAGRQVMRHHSVQHPGVAQVQQQVAVVTMASLRNDVALQVPHTYTPSAATSLHSCGRHSTPKRQPCAACVT